jgi:AraC-like DNA-binding protein
MSNTIQRAPSPALRPFLRTLWVSRDDRGPAKGAEQREHVLPTGDVHIVFRLAGPALRLFDGPDDPVGRTLARAIVGGARSGYYLRDVSQPVFSVGAQLLPGAAPLLFGVAAGEIAERHTPLEDLWGAEVREIEDRLAVAGSDQDRLALFEKILAERLPRIRGIHPAVAQALAGLGAREGVGSLVERSGYSHRRFVALFREAVGLSPKRYARVLRFRRMLDRVAAPTPPPLAELALEAGYSDQAHFNREFRELAGVTPGEYRTLAPASGHHVPVPGRPARSG